LPLIAALIIVDNKLQRGEKKICFEDYEGTKMPSRQPASLLHPRQRLETLECALCTL